MNSVDKAKCALLREALRADIASMIHHAEISLDYLDMPRPDDAGLLYSLRVMLAHMKSIAASAVELRDIRECDVITDDLLRAAARRKETGDANELTPEI